MWVANTIWRLEAGFTQPLKRKMGRHIRAFLATYPEGPIKGFSEWARLNDARLLEFAGDGGAVA